MHPLARVNLNRLLIFTQVVEAGSLTEAARRLGLSKTLVSSHIQKLEAEMGVALLIRTTRQLRPTEVGQEFFDACRNALGELETAIADAGRDATEVAGLLRVTAPVDMGTNILAPLAVELRHAHPGLRLDLVLTDQVLDLVAERIDLAIRVGWLRDSGQQTVRLGSFDHWLVAPAAWADFVTGLATPADAAALPLVGVSRLPQPARWTFTAPDGTAQEVVFDTPIMSSSPLAARAALEAGGGLGIMPDFALADGVHSGRLIRLLPDWQLPKGGIHAVWPANRHRSRRMQVLLTALKQRLSP